MVHPVRAALRAALLSAASHARPRSRLRTAAAPEPGLGFVFIALFATAFALRSLRRFDQRWFLGLAVRAIPLPWIAAEHRLQPWAIDGVLPTGLAPSSLGRGELWATLGGFPPFCGTLPVTPLAA